MLGIGGLYTAFSLGYATIMLACYAPLVATLIGLVLSDNARSLETMRTRARDAACRVAWLAAFWLGGVATLALVAWLIRATLVGRVAGRVRQDPSGAGRLRGARPNAGAAPRHTSAAPERQHL